MKRVVFLDDLKESDIRPENIYNEYKEILNRDIQKYFSDPSALIKIDCPGCSDKNTEFAFDKMGLTYRTCHKCGSLFVSPRPSDDALRHFYKNSNAGIFVRKIVLENMSEARSKQIFSYRIQWVMGLIEEYNPDANIYLDYATKYPNLLKQLNSTGLFKSIVSVLPECYEQENLSCIFWKNPVTLWFNYANCLKPANTIAFCRSSRIRLLRSKKVFCLTEKNR